MSLAGLNPKQAIFSFLALVAMVAAALMLLRQWRTDWSDRNSTFTAPKQLKMVCSLCGEVFASSGSDYVAQLRANAKDFLVACPKCGQVAARPGTQCASCQKYFLHLGHDGKGTRGCPGCNAGTTQDVPGSEIVQAVRR